MKFADVKLGKLPKKDDRRTLQFTDYKTTALPMPPASRQWGPKVTRFPMYGNDRLGDCTCAAAGHMEQVWTSWNARPWTPNEQQVLNMYWATGDQDDGRYLLDVLNYWRNHGLAGTNKIELYAEIYPPATVEVKQAINLFGGIYIGLMLPVECQDMAPWRLTPGMQPGSWGGHCVNITAYTTSYLTCISWGTRIRMTWPFFRATCDEAYACLTHDFSPGLPGYDFASLENDLQQLGAP